MTTPNEFDVAPMSGSEQEGLRIACASSILKERFPGIIALAQTLSEHEAAEAGGNWILDVYFVPSSRLLEFEDFAADLSIALLDEAKVSVLIISHTEDATKQYHLEMLKQCCPFDLENRGPGIVISDVFAMRVIPPSWLLPNATVKSLTWSELQETNERTIREAA